MYLAGESFPAVTDLRGVAEIIGVSYSRARHLQAEGKLRSFETALRIGGRIRYSGVKLQQWAESAPGVEATGRRYWGGTQR